MAWADLLSLPKSRGSLGATWLGLHSSLLGDTQLLWRGVVGPQDQSAVCCPEVLHRARFRVSVCPRTEQRGAAEVWCCCTTALPPARALGWSKGPVVQPRLNNTA